MDVFGARIFNQSQCPVHHLDQPNTADVLVLPKYAPISNVHKSPANAAIYQVANGKRAFYPIDREAASGEYVIFSSI